MFNRILALTLGLSIPALGVACDVSEPTDEPTSDVGGKSDQLDDSDEELLSCPADVYVTHAVNEVNDHIFSNCHNAETGRFTARACCADDLELIEDVSGCPSQVRFTSVSDASAKRCMNDVEGHAGFGEFVPTACCAALCDDNSYFDDYGYCRQPSGHFDEKICCLRNESLSAANCNGAQWEEIEGGTRDFACRAPNGQFTFDACCVDQCTATISKTAQIPESCSLDFDAGAECPSDASPNSAGICHNPGNGQFVKAVCCELSGAVEGLDTQGSDDCYAGTAQQAACI